MHARNPPRSSSTTPPHAANAPPLLASVRPTSLLADTSSPLQRPRHLHHTRSVARAVRARLCTLPPQLGTARALPSRHLTKQPAPPKTIAATTRPQGRRTPRQRTQPSPLTPPHSPAAPPGGHDISGLAVTPPTKRRRTSRANHTLFLPAKGMEKDPARFSHPRTLTRPEPLVQAKRVRRQSRAPPHALPSPCAQRGWAPQAPSSSPQLTYSAAPQAGATQLSLPLPSERGVTCSHHHGSKRTRRRPLKAALAPGDRGHSVPGGRRSQAAAPHKRTLR